MHLVVFEVVLFVILGATTDISMFAVCLLKVLPRISMIS